MYCTHTYNTLYRCSSLFPCRYINMYIYVIYVPRVYCTLLFSVKRKRESPGWWSIIYFDSPRRHDKLQVTRYEDKVYKRSTQGNQRGRKGLKLKLKNTNSGLWLFSWKSQDSRVRRESFVILILCVNFGFPISKSKGNWSAGSKGQLSGEGIVNWTGFYVCILY